LTDVFHRTIVTNTPLVIHVTLVVGTTIVVGRTAKEGQAPMTKLAAYLEEHNITHADLARRSDVSRRTVLELANGLRTRATLETWVKLARGLGCNVYEISEDAHAQMVGAV
jgi:DNA-binding XRE family transcriptional regulator